MYEPVDGQKRSMLQTKWPFFLLQKAKSRGRFGQNVHFLLLRLEKWHFARGVPHFFAPWKAKNGGRSGQNGCFSRRTSPKRKKVAFCPRPPLLLALMAAAFWPGRSSCVSPCNPKNRGGRPKMEDGRAKWPFFKSGVPTKRRKVAFCTRRPLFLALCSFLAPRTAKN